MDIKTKGIFNSLSDLISLSIKIVILYLHVDNSVFVGIFLLFEAVFIGVFSFDRINSVSVSGMHYSLVNLLLCRICCIGFQVLASDYKEDDCDEDYASNDNYQKYSIIGLVDARREDRCVKLPLLARPHCPISVV